MPDFRVVTSSTLTPPTAFLIPGNVPLLYTLTNHLSCEIWAANPNGWIGLCLGTWKAVSAPQVEFAGAAGTVPDFPLPPLPVFYMYSTYRTIFS